MRKLTYAEQRQEIAKILRSARPGDIGDTRSTTFFGGGIRTMTSRGLHKAWGNHNFPIWRDATSNSLVTLQINGGQRAEVVPLGIYLANLYATGGRVIIVRPDCFVSNEPSPEQMSHMVSYWLSLEGTKYDNKSIWQILKMYIRLRKHVPENGKESVYCTEGTIEPYKTMPRPWTPDILMAEKYPVPIHVEHLIRAGRVVYGGGSMDIYKMIRDRY